MDILHVVHVYIHSRPGYYPHIIDLIDTAFLVMNTVFPRNLTVRRLHFKNLFDVAACYLKASTCRFPSANINRYESDVYY